MNPTFDVCALGCVCWDLLGTVEHYPALDEKVPLLEFTQHGGGRAGTAAAAIVAMGGQVAIFGRISDDKFGEYILEEFAASGVNTDGLEIIPGEASQFAFCVAHRQTGQRTIFYKHGSMSRISADGIDLDALTDCRCLLIDSHHPGASIAGAKVARAKGVPVVLDAERLEPRLDELFATSDYIIVPAGLVEALEEEDEAAGRSLLLRHNPTALVVTRGADGADVYQGQDSFHQPAFLVPEVVDTTGAGDVFHGAFAYCVALGYELADCVASASAAAALSTTALGGRGHLPLMAEVKALVHGPDSR